jgi:hypothetical protein
MATRVLRPARLVFVLLIVLVLTGWRVQPAAAAAPT